MRNHFTIGTYLMAFVALVDQATKYWVLNVMHMTAGMQFNVTSFFNVVLSWNKGITFGLLNQHSEHMPWILTGIAFLVVVLLLVWLWRAETLFEALGLGFVLGGAIGNVIDRLRFGAVVDFLDFFYGSYHWYTFNMADSAIVVGVGLLMLDNLVASRKKS